MMAEMERACGRINRLDVRNLLCNDTASPAFEVDQAKGSYGEVHATLNPNEHTKASIDRSNRELPGKLLECLNDITTAGCFSTYHRKTSYVNPGLHVDGLGLIPFPLSTRDAEALVQVSKGASSGKRDETFTDTTLRKIWEIDSSKVQFRNPAWQNHLAKLVADSTSTLGIDFPIRAEICKLILYEEGASFRSQKDAEGIPSTFGSLVLCLPSRHEGGDVHFSHGGQEKLIKPDEGSEFDLSLYSWYSDVSHEVKTVTSGYRLVITYNLVGEATKSSIKSAQAVHDQRMRLRVLLKMWRDKSVQHFRRGLTYILDNRYDLKEGSIKSLKGRDKLVADHVWTICRENGFYMFLASMDHSSSTSECDDDEFSDDDHGGYHTEPPTDLENIMTPDGVVLSSTRGIRVKDILQIKPFERDPDSESDDGYPSRYGTPVSRYHDTVLVICPREQLFHFFFEGDQDTIDESNLINFIGQEALNQRQNVEMQKIASSIMKQAAESYYASRRTQTGYHFGAALLKWSIALQNQELFSVAVEGSIRGEGLLTDEMLKQIVDAVICSNSKVMPNWEQWFGIVIEKTNTLGNLQDVFNRFKTLLSISTFSPTPLLSSFDAWAAAKFHEQLSKQNTFYREDAPILVQFMETCSREWITEKLLTILCAQNNKAFFMTFLTALYKKRSEEHFSSIVADVFRGVLNQKMGLLSLVSTDLGTVLTAGSARAPGRSPPSSMFGSARSFSSSIRYKDASYYRSPPSQVSVSSLSSSLTPSGTDFLALFQSTLDLGLSKEVEVLLETSTVNIASKHGILDLDSEVTVPFIQNFLQKSREHDTGPPTAIIQAFVEVLLQGMTIPVQKKWPVKPIGWARTLRGCGCRDCQLLDIFLADAHRMTERFRFPETRRKHLEHRLGYMHFYIETDRSHGSPHTLIVTKTDREYQEQLDRWNRSRSELTSRLKTLENDQMKELLGDKYASLLLLEQPPVLRVPMASKSMGNLRQALSSTSSSQLNGYSAGIELHGVKRKAGSPYIDLSSSDN